MQSTLQINDYILIDKLSYRFKIERNDILIFDPPFFSENKYVKRCLGLPGDSIFIGKFSGIAWSSLYPKKIAEDSGQHVFLVVPKKGLQIKINIENFKYYENALTQYENVLNFSSEEFYHEFKYDYLFMTGDNYASSYDSRNWGMLPKKLVYGKCALVLMSIDSVQGFQLDRFLSQP